MKNIPKKIFLQTGLEEYGETCEDFETLSNLSWCSDKIYSDDLTFISVDFILARIKELESEMENEDSSFSFADCKFRISELKNLIK